MLLFTKESFAAGGIFIVLEKQTAKTDNIIKHC